MSQAAAMPPLGYEPFHVLNLCSNRLEDVQFPILINGGLAPLLIGKGSAPRVWLSSGVVKGDQQMFFQVVVDNFSRSPQVRVASLPGSTIVYHGSTVVCRVREIRPDEAEVTELDLRPAGLNMHGDASTLFIGNTRYSGNVITGGKAFVNIG